MSDIRQTNDYSRYLSSLGWTVLGIGGVYYFIKKIPLLGSVLKIQRPDRINPATITSLSKKFRVFQILIEPATSAEAEMLIGLGYRKSGVYYSPSKTLQIDLTQKQGELLTKMHHKTRYNIRKAIRNGLKIAESVDIQKFADFWQNCASSQRGMFLDQTREIVALYNSFNKKAKIITIGKNGKTLSGVLMVFSERSAHYMYAASIPEGKTLFAPTLNVWAALKCSKKLGLRTFDFEGIFDARFPQKSWAGFTRFKESFGGNEIEYPGCFTKIRVPFL